MVDADLILDAEWLIPLADGQTAPSYVSRSSVIVTDGVIVDIIATADVDARYRAARRIDLHGHAVLPGFVNAHTHAAMNLFRGFADDLPLKTWLEQHLWPAESAFVDENFVRAGSELAILEMLSSGTTTFNDMYFFPDVTAVAAQRCGIRAVVGLIVIGFPSSWADSVDEYFAAGLRVYDSLQDLPMVSASFAPHAPYSVDDPALSRVATLAEELDIPVHMHIHETRDEVVTAEREHGERPLRRLERHGLLNNRLIAVHMTELSKREISNFAKYGGSIVHCPQSNLKLASGICPVQDLVDAGINVALGTDGAASNNDLDMFGEMQTAALLGKIHGKEPSAVPAEFALRMATINGARALGVDPLVGSIEIGKRADLIAVDLDHPATQPVYNPISQIVYAATRDQVSHVVIDGEIKVENGEVLGLDRDDVMTRAREYQRRIAATR